MLAACGGSSGARASETQAEQRRRIVYAISQIERNFHEAISKKNIDQMISLFAPNATGTFGPGRDGDRERADPAGLAERGQRSSPRRTGCPTIPRTSSKVTVNGDRGTLHFECHFIDVKTGKVAAITAGDQDVARIDGPLADHELRRKHGRAEDLSAVAGTPDAARDSSRRRTNAGC